MALALGPAGGAGAAARLAYLAKLERGQPGEERAPVREQSARRAGDELIAHPDGAVRGYGGRIVAPAGHVVSRESGEGGIAAEAVLGPRAQGRDVDPADRPAGGEPDVRGAPEE